jgi:hypothetical protein
VSTRIIGRVCLCLWFLNGTFHSDEGSHAVSEHFPKLSSALNLFVSDLERLLYGFMHVLD